MSHSLRRGQLVAPFGVGALFDIGQESFACVDVSRWHPNSRARIVDSELERRLDREIHTPRGGKAGTGVPVVRFPRWLFCPSCRSLQFYAPARDEANRFDSPGCPSCRKLLAPMGFVAACRDGHLQDVDWYRWAHRNAQPARQGQCSEQASTLRFTTSGRSGGDWDALAIVCTCGAKQTFEGLVGPELPAAMMPCRGGQPWQKDRKACSKQVRVFRRGAGNLYYPRTVSALDLLPMAGTTSLNQLVAAVRAADSFPIMQVWARVMGGLKVPDHLPQIERPAMAVADQFGCTFEEAVEAVLVACNDITPDGIVGSPIVLDGVQQSILEGEWPTLARSSPAKTQLIDVLPLPVPSSWASALRSGIRGITLVRRLREVRALVGFQRISPDSDSPVIPVDLGNGVRWLPGTEVRGEGVFLWFNQDRVHEWEESVRSTLRNRIDVLAAACQERGWDAASLATPRFLMLHTFAHAMVRRLAFDAGYSSASLRERIYASPGALGMAGVLIYTADSDSEGSLGGLVRMGEQHRLERTMQNALHDAAWCSADPICRESAAQGVGGTNAAACHACTLISETSCVHSNALLDRRTLVRTEGMPIGFFDLARMES